MANDAVSEQQDVIEKNYENIQTYLNIHSQFELLIHSRERKISRVDFMLEDIDSLPVCQQAGARSRLEDQLEMHYEEWYKLQGEQDEVKENIFESVDYVPLLKEAKEKLEFESFMNEACYYMDIVAEQTQQWLDAGCPEDDGEEWMH